MRGSRWAAAVVVVGTVIGCQPLPTSTGHPTSSPPPTTGLAGSPTASIEPRPTPLPSGVLGAFETTIAGPDGSFPIDVTVLDRTGLITRIEGSLPDLFDDESVLVDAPAPDGGLQLTWVMRGCSRHAVITFETAELGIQPETYRLSAVHEDQDGSCLAAMIGRTLTLQLSRPVSAANVIVLPPAVHAFRLMFDRFVDQFPTEFEMLDTTGLVTGLANTNRRMRHIGVNDAAAPDRGVYYAPVPNMCTYRIAMVFTATATATSTSTAAAYKLDVRFDTGWRDGCAMNASGRWVFIQLSDPVRAANIELVESGT